MALRLRINVECGVTLISKHFLQFAFKHSKCFKNKSRHSLFGVILYVKQADTSSAISRDVVDIVYSLYLRSAEGNTHRVRFHSREINVRASKYANHFQVS